MQTEPARKTATIKNLISQDTFKHTGDEKKKNHLGDDILIYDQILRTKFKGMLEKLVRRIDILTEES